MRTFVLSVKERLGLGGILNKKYQQGGLSLATLSIAQKILEKLMIDEPETKDIKLENKNGRLTWDLKKDKGKQVEFNEDQAKLLKEIINGLSEKKEFSLEDGYIVELVEKINAE